jgi:glutathione S-transferase
MRLYHQPGSRSSRVLWALEESGASFETTEISAETKKTPEYRAIHPLGRAPGFEADGGPLFESAALCLYVADEGGDSGLNWPVGSYERGLVYQWTLFAATELEPPASAMWAAQRASDAEAETAALERFRNAAQVVETTLAGGEYLVGGRFSIADVMVGDVIGWGKGFDGAFEGLPNLVAYLNRLEARPAYQRANPA